MLLLNDLHFDLISSIFVNLQRQRQTISQVSNGYIFRFWNASSVFLAADWLGCRVFHCLEVRGNTASYPRPHPSDTGGSVERGIRESREYDFYCYTNLSIIAHIKSQQR